MAIKSVGIEIQENRVKLLCAEVGGKFPKITAFVEQPITLEEGQDPLIGVAAALKQAFLLSKAPKGRVVIAIDSAEAVLREIVVPFKEPDQVRSVVPHELESLVHNYAIEDLVVDYFKTGESEKGTHVHAVAVPKKIVAGRLQIAEGAAVDPMALDLDVAALFNALNTAGAIDTEEPFLILHGTARFSKLIFVEGRKPKSIRTIRFSLPNVGEAGSVVGPAPGAEPIEALDAPGEEFPENEPIAVLEQKTRELPGPVPIILVEGGDAAKLSELDFETRSALLEILAKEISRFLLANAASVTPKHLLLSGDFEDEEAMALLEAATRLPTKTFALLDTVKHSFLPDEKDVGRRIGVPFGLALKGAGVDLLGLDFRRGEFSFKRKFAAVKTTLLVTVELLAVLFAAVALHFYFDTKAIRTFDPEGNNPGAIQVVHLAQSEIFFNVFNREPDDPALSYSLMRDEEQKLREELGEGLSDFPMRSTALETGGALFRSMEQFRQQFLAQDPDLWLQLDMVKLEFQKRRDKEEIDLAELRIEGLVKNPDHPERLKEALVPQKELASLEWENVELAVPVEGKRKFTLRAKRDR